MAAEFWRCSSDVGCLSTTQEALGSILSDRRMNENSCHCGRPSAHTQWGWANQKLIWLRRNSMSGFSCFQTMRACLVLADTSVDGILHCPGRLLWAFHPPRGPRSTSCFLWRLRQGLGMNVKVTHCCSRQCVPFGFLVLPDSLLGQSQNKNNW